MLLRRRFIYRIISGDAFPFTKTGHCAAVPLSRAASLARYRRRALADMGSRWRKIDAGQYRRGP